MKNKWFPSNCGYFSTACILLGLLSVIFYTSLHANTSPSTSSANNKATATLIVSYQTGAKEERLDRVRFRLCNEEYEQQLYPKGIANGNNDSNNNNSNIGQRVIVIEGLAEGKYKLQFLIPNSDDLFESIPERTFDLRPGQVLKIDQQIRPRYAALKAIANTTADAMPFTVLPTITLENQFKEIRAQSTVGKLNVHYLLPGSYQLTFDPLPGYTTPDPIEITLQPNEYAGPFVGTYTSIL